MERRGCLVPGIRVRSPTVLRLRGILPHCHRRGTDVGVHSSREFPASVWFDDAVRVLDALAHVTLVLDSRLCLLPADAAAPRPLVAKSLLADFDGAVWVVAQGNTAFPDLGLLSRRAARPAPPDRCPTAQIRLDSSSGPVESRLVDHHDGPGQSRVDILPFQFAATSTPNARSDSLPRNLCSALLEWKSLS